ncbi:MAG: hypothetical protein QM234_06565, partial [Acidobacteriota bacterium]|nr:hypothetical protein [Acidobacteriota bacterium]
MSKKAKLSPSELKALALENCDRFLVVHCGFCLDENSKVDRTQPLGWLTHRPGNKTSPSVWRVVASHGQTDVMQRLICPKCLRYLDMPDNKYS